MWDLPSFTIGLIAGFIIIIIITWILVYSRSFMFSVMPRRNRRNICSKRDYYADPGDAIADGSQVEDILFLNQDDKLLYKRVPRSTICTPLSATQTVTINHPQFCYFRGEDGNDYEGKNAEFDSPLYTYTGADGKEASVITSGNCTVISSDYDFVTGGLPLLKWNSN